MNKKTSNRRIPKCRITKLLIEEQLSIQISVLNNSYYICTGYEVCLVRGDEGMKKLCTALHTDQS